MRRLSSYPLVAQPIERQVDPSHQRSHGQLPQIEVDAADGQRRQVRQQRRHARAFSCRSPKRPGGSRSDRRSLRATRPSSYAVYRHNVSVPVVGDGRFASFFRPYTRVAATGRQAASSQHGGRCCSHRTKTPSAANDVEWDVLGHVGRPLGVALGKRLGVRHAAMVRAHLAEREFKSRTARYLFREPPPPPLGGPPLGPAGCPRRSEWGKDARVAGTTT
jgi:hypothetical protein